MKITPKNIAKLSKAFPEVGKHFDFKGEVVLQVTKNNVILIGLSSDRRLREVIINKSGWILNSTFTKPAALVDLVKIEEIISREDISPIVFMNESADKIIEATATRFIEQAIQIHKSS